MIFWIFYAIIDWILIVSSIIPICYKYYFLIPFSLFIIGSRQHALAILVHDGAHKLISKNKKTNNLINWVFAAGPLGVNMKNYREFHFKHHRFLGTEKDPEIIARNQIETFKILPEYKDAIKTFILDCLGFAIRDFYKIVSFLSIKSLIIWWCIFFMVVPTPYNLVISILWFVSIPTVFWGCFRLRSMTEHIGIRGTYLIYANWLERFVFLPHNTYFHAEHHHNPSIPFYRLSKIRKEKGISVKRLWSNAEKDKKNIF